MMLRKKNKRIISAIVIVMITLLILPTFSLAEKEGKGNEEDVINYVSLGDSIATGFSIVEPTKSYPKLLKKYFKDLDSRKVRATYLARTGDTTSDLLDLLIVNEEKDDLHFNAHQIQAIEEADYITISIGGNNLLQAVDPNEMTVDYELLNQGMYEYTAQMVEILHTIRIMNPEAQVYVLNIYNPFNAFPIGGYEFELNYNNYGIYASLEYYINDINGLNWGLRGMIFAINTMYINSPKMKIVDIYTGYKMEPYQPSGMGSITYMYPTILGYNTEGLIFEHPRDIHPKQVGQDFIFNEIMRLLTD